MIRRLLLLAGLASALLAAAPARAHKASDGYLALGVAGERIEGQWDIALRDLEQAIGLDADGDGTITWGELVARHAAIAAYALPGLVVEADGAVCPLAPLDHLVDRHTDGAYAVLRFEARCRAEPRALRLAYHLLADVDPLHRGLVRLDDGTFTHTAVLGPEAPELRLSLREPPDLLRQALSYGRQGVWHIWIGFDHILFLLSLLLPAVLRRQSGAWQAVEHFREALVEVLKVVTAFTLAHSVTLTLAALEVVALPSRLVESVIAVSVVLAAVNNIRPMVDRRLWLVAFGFGLVHGLGFAGALEELGLPQEALVASLVAFNVGVELGQLTIVAAFLPLAFALRRTALYPRLVLRAGSTAIASIAGLWLLERAFDLALL
jgi:hypothetical protein